MGIRYQWEWTLEAARAFSGLNWCDIGMLELGNQHFVGYGPDRDHQGTVKQWAKDRGLRQHVSIDINGKDGAYLYDLRLPLPAQYVNYQIVTNFGTSEHIDQQEPVFKNIHEVCAINGIMLHVVPLVGHWPGHCLYRYAECFFSRLVMDNLYRVRILTTLPKCHAHDELLIAILQRRSKANFIFYPTEGLQKGP